MMKTMTQGKIFLADQRGLKESQKLKRFSTFNFEKFAHPAKTAIDPLYLFNDDMLAGNQKTCFEVDRDSYFIIIPITGAVNYLDDSENETDVDVEEAAIVYVERGANITLSNPFENEIINYLCIGLAAHEPMENNPRFFSFDLEKQNMLIKLSAKDLPFALHIGRFQGRNEVNLAIDLNSKIFVSVITGAFEVQGRLLHEKDGLALWDTEMMEIEALSNNAVVLTIEFTTSS